MAKKKKKNKKVSYPTNSMERSAYNARHLPNPMHLDACKQGMTITQNLKKYNRKRQKAHDREDMGF